MLSPPASSHAHRQGLPEFIIVDKLEFFTHLKVLASAAAQLTAAIDTARCLAGVTAIESFDAVSDLSGKC